MPSAPDFRVELLDSKRHDRGRFTCGVASLDEYLKSQASQDMRRKANAVFVLAPIDEPTQIAGYFTLCAYAVDQGHVPETARRYIPRYPLVSATLIGRLAIAARFQGRGIGAMLLVRALRMANENAGIVGSSMVVVDAIDEKAARFYAAHGSIRLPDSMRLIMPMRMIGDLLAE